MMHRRNILKLLPFGEIKQAMALTSLQQLRADALECLVEHPSSDDISPVRLQPRLDQILEERVALRSDGDVVGRPIAGKSVDKFGKKILLQLSRRVQNAADPMNLVGVDGISGDVTQID